MGEGVIQLEGTVHSVVFQNPGNGYAVLRLLTAEGEVVTAVGCVPAAAPGEGLTVSGVWETHPQHGEQLRILEAERRLPETEEDLVQFLASGVCKGVGMATARRMVSLFGADTLDVLESAPERLTRLRGMTEQRARDLSAAFRQTMGLRRLMEFLSRFQLPPVLAVRLRERFGDAALEKIRENPWLLSLDGAGAPPTRLP